MRKQLLLLALASLALGPARGQTVRSVYADFGPNDVTNGNSTHSPDANSNYLWTTTPQGPGPGAAVSTTAPHAGTYSAKLTGGSLALAQQISYASMAGTTSYKLSGYFYNPAADALRGSQGAHLELCYYSSSQALLGRFKSDSLVASSATGT